MSIWGGLVPAVASDVVPTNTNLYDLGTTTLRWKNLWLQGNATIAGNLVLGGTVTPTGQVLIIPGLVGAPGLAVVGDTNTGVYQPSADQLAVTIGGAQCILFAAAGITVTYVDDARLTLNATGSGTGSGGTFLWNRAGALAGSLGVQANRINDSSAATLLHAISGFNISTGASATNRFLTLDTVGRLSGTALHNNGSGLAGTTNQFLGSGFYTPTLTAVANVAASTSAQCQWMRVGNVVTVSGTISIDPTAAATLTQLGISLPIASNLSVAGGTECAGTAVRTTAATNFIAGNITSDTVNDRAELDFFCDADAANRTWAFSFTYLIA